jgi:hypothetical protein
MNTGHDSSREVHVSVCITMSVKHTKASGNDSAERIRNVYAGLKISESREFVHAGMAAVSATLFSLSSLQCAALESLTPPNRPIALEHSWKSGIPVQMKLTDSFSCGFLKTLIKRLYLAYRSLCQMWQSRSNKAC